MLVNFHRKFIIVWIWHNDKGIIFFVTSIVMEADLSLNVKSTWTHSRKFGRYRKWPDWMGRHTSLLTFFKTLNSYFLLADYGFCYYIIRCCRVVLQHIYTNTLIFSFSVSISPHKGLQGVISLGRPRPFCPATELHKCLQPLAGFHALSALPDEVGPSVVQRPGFYTEEEIQGHREAVNTQGHTPNQSRGGRGVCDLWLPVHEDSTHTLLNDCLWGYKGKFTHAVDIKMIKHWGTHKTFKCKFLWKKNPASVCVVDYSKQLCVAAICDNTHKYECMETHATKTWTPSSWPQMCVCVAWFKQDDWTVFLKKIKCLRWKLTNG